MLTSTKMRVHPLEWTDWCQQPGNQRGGGVTPGLVPSGVLLLRAQHRCAELGGGAWVARWSTKSTARNRGRSNGPQPPTGPLALPRHSTPEASDNVLHCTAVKHLLAWRGLQNACPTRKCNCHISGYHVRITCRHSFNFMSFVVLFM